MTDRKLIMAGAVGIGALYLLMQKPAAKSTATVTTTTTPTVSPQISGTYQGAGAGPNHYLDGTWIFNGTGFTPGGGVKFVIEPVGGAYVIQALVTSADGQGAAGLAIRPYNAGGSGEYWIYGYDVATGMKSGIVNAYFP